MTCATISSFNVPHLAPVNAFGPAAGATFSAPYHAAPTVSPSYAPAHAPVFLRMQHEDAPVLLAPSGIPAPAGMHGNAPMMTEPQLTPAYYHPAADAAVPAPAVPVHVPMEVACKDVCNAACGVYSPVLCACSRDVCSDSRCPGYEPGACGVPVTETLVSILKEFMRRMFPGH
ncbi:hypothetical protein FJZ28_02185 [Candidatus Peregrinibacteria bacterium]|nr:hypothetical protein [Candidatus Peregrinibacteria bacterium]